MWCSSQPGCSGCTAPRCATTTSHNMCTPFTAPRCRTQQPLAAPAKHLTWAQHGIAAAAAAAACHAYRGGRVNCHTSAQVPSLTHTCLFVKAGRVGRVGRAGRTRTTRRVTHTTHQHHTQAPSSAAAPSVGCVAHHGGGQGPAAVLRQDSPCSAATSQDAVCCVCLMPCSLAPCPVTLPHCS